MDFYSVSDFYKRLFGQKVYKISVKGGCTCPNRDGTLDTRGCIFCSGSGSGDFAFEDLEKAKQIVGSKFGSNSTNSSNKYIVYFQNFTNTYENAATDFDFLSSQFLRYSREKEVVGIAIGTRPDCLSDKMLDFLAKLSAETYVQLEFGLQSASDLTATYIRRCYKTAVYEETMARVKEKAPKIHVVTHIIFGLPGEGEKEMLDSVRLAVKCHTDGIKITCLHVLKGTDLAKDYEEGKFDVLSMEEYFALIKKAVGLIPKETVIHRLTGDGPKSLLIAPLWTADKKRVLNGLRIL